MNVGYACGLCPDGMVGNGVHCSRTDPCVSNPCYPGATCTMVNIPIHSQDSNPEVMTPVSMGRFRNKIWCFGAKISNYQQREKSWDYFMTVEMLSRKSQLCVWPVSPWFDRWWIRTWLPITTPSVWVKSMPSGSGMRGNRRTRLRVWRLPRRHNRGWSIMHGYKTILPIQLNETLLRFSKNHIVW